MTYCIDGEHVNCSTKKQVNRMKCPHLSTDNKCLKMLEEKLYEELTDFDIKHYCKGNPINCFYFRKLIMKRNPELIEQTEFLNNPLNNSLILKQNKTA